MKCTKLCENRMLIRHRYGQVDSVIMRNGDFMVTSNRVQDLSYEFRLQSHVGIFSADPIRRPMVVCTTVRWYAGSTPLSFFIHARSDTRKMIWKCASYENCSFVRTSSLDSHLLKRTVAIEFSWSLRRVKSVSKSNSVNLIKAVFKQSTWEKSSTYKSANAETKLDPK